MTLRNYKNSHIGNCKHTRESATVKYITYVMGKITLHVAQIVNTEQLQNHIP